MPVESLLAEDVDGFVFGESVLLHGGACLGSEVGDLRLGVAVLSSNGGGLTNVWHN